jgi:hypothetical protein
MNLRKFTASMVLFAAASFGFAATQALAQNASNLIARTAVLSADPINPSPLPPPPEPAITRTTLSQDPINPSPLPPPPEPVI